MLLAVDTSTRWVGLALYDATAVISERIWQTRGYHTVELAGAIDRLLEGNGIKPVDLKALAVATGPGSFTSLRIGLALVKGLAFALKIPLLGIPSLDVLVAAIPTSDCPLLAVLQAGRGRLAMVRYEADTSGWHPVSQPVICDVQGLFNLIKGQTLVAGELDAEQRHLLSDRRRPILLASPAVCLRRPSYLAELAWKRYVAGEQDDPLGLSPIYVHIAENLPD
jgi:tRNA threonylcarbamoyladenosine biosynthesis protein TsaB